MTRTLLRTLLASVAVAGVLAAASPASAAPNKDTAALIDEIRTLPTAFKANGLIAVAANHASLSAPDRVALYKEAYTAAKVVNPEYDSKLSTYALMVAPADWDETVLPYGAFAEESNFSSGLSQLSLQSRAVKGVARLDASVAQDLFSRLPKPPAVVVSCTDEAMPDVMDYYSAAESIIDTYSTGKQKAVFLRNLAENAREADHLRSALGIISEAEGLTAAEAAPVVSAVADAFDRIRDDDTTFTAEYPAIASFVKAAFWDSPIAGADVSAVQKAYGSFVSWHQGRSRCDHSAMGDARLLEAEANALTPAAAKSARSAKAAQPIVTPPRPKVGMLPALFLSKQYALAVEASTLGALPNDGEPEPATARSAAGRAAPSTQTQEALGKDLLDSLKSATDARQGGSGFTLTEQFAINNVLATTLAINAFAPAQIGTAVTAAVSNLGRSAPMEADPVTWERDVRVLLSSGSDTAAPATFDSVVAAATQSGNPVLAAYAKLAKRGLFGEPVEVLP